MFLTVNNIAEAPDVLILEHMVITKYKNIDIRPEILRYDYCGNENISIVSQKFWAAFQESPYPLGPCIEHDYHLNYYDDQFHIYCTQSAIAFFKLRGLEYGPINNEDSVYIV